MVRESICDLVDDERDAKLREDEDCCLCVRSGVGIGKAKDFGTDTAPAQDLLAVYLLALALLQLGVRLLRSFEMQAVGITGTLPVFVAPAWDCRHCSPSFLRSPPMMGWSDSSVPGGTALFLSFPRATISASLKVSIAYRMLCTGAWPRAHLRGTGSLK